MVQRQRGIVVFDPLSHGGVTGLSASEIVWVSRLSGRRLARGPSGGGRSERQNKVFSSHVTPGVFVHLER